MTFRRLVAALCLAAFLVAPAVNAQEAPSPGESIEAIVSAYATGGDGGTIGEMTASGVRTHWGTVAADWHLYPLGTKLRIEGFPDDIFTVEDSGGAVKGKVFDVWFPDLAAAEAFGTRHLKVVVLPPGDY